MSKRGWLLSAVLCAILTAPLCKAEDACDRARALFRVFPMEASARAEVVAAFKEQWSYFNTRELAVVFCRELEQNLLDKQAATANGANFKKEEIIARAIRYEGFRLTSYLSSGVSPKRYFGFVDLQGSTASYERLLAQVVRDVVPLINTFAQERKLRSRVTAKEVIVTFLAEGGALLLSKSNVNVERIHPVYGIGLDDFRSGFKKYSQLVTQIDQIFGTNLQGLTLSVGAKSILLRPMTFREAVLGTAIMYLFEKELTASYMKQQWRAELMALPIDDQFIATSLVYNSGILFERERIAQIKAFATGEYLAAVNEKSNRPKLAVYAPSDRVQLLKREGKIPTQYTSWSAVYHVLQRYGAWVALDNYMDGGIAP